MKKIAVYILWAVMLFVCCFPQCVDAQYVIVVSNTSDMDSLSVDDLKKIFKGASPHRLSSKKNRQVVEYGPACDKFYKSLYGQSSYSLTKHWLRLVFTGKRVLPPKSFSDSEKFARFLIRNEAAIGFLPVDVFVRLSKQSIRSITILGQRYHYSYLFDD